MPTKSLHFYVHLWFALAFGALNLVVLSIHQNQNLVLAFLKNSQESSHPDNFAWCAPSVPRIVDTVVVLCEPF